MNKEDKDRLESQLKEVEDSFYKFADEVVSNSREFIKESISTEYIIDNNLQHQLDDLQIKALMIISNCDSYEEILRSHNGQTIDEMLEQTKSIFNK